MKKTIVYIIFFFVIATLCTCKKYPENILWFKNPKKISPFYGYLKKYTVNGIDSLDLLNIYFSNSVGLVKDIRIARFDTYLYGGGRTESYLLYNGFIMGASYEYFKKNRYIKLSCGGDTSVFRKNLFGKDVEWKILQLGKDPFKATTTLANGNKYEIEIGT